MAIRCLKRAVIPTTKSLAAIFAQSYTTAASSSGVLSRPSFVLRLRPLAGAAACTFHPRLLAPAISTRGFATRQTASSLNDQNPNWSNRPPKETILLDGCDFEHWLVVMDPPPENATRDEIIDKYIKTLALVVGSEEEARMKIYSVSTRCYFAFGALVSEELSLKLKELDGVRWVLPDSYLDVKNKDYGGEPFINGQAVPYESKYHEEWIRNNSRANERNRRNDRPRNFDRSRNFERRRDNLNSGGPQNYNNVRPPPPPPPPNASNAGGMNAGQGNYPPPNSNPVNYPPRGPPPSDNNAPNYHYRSNSGPPGGMAPGMGPGQGQNQNNAYVPQNVGGGSHYQSQNAPPHPQNNAYSQGQNSGGFGHNGGYGTGPGTNQNSYGQNPNGYGQPHGQGQNHGGYGNNPPRDYGNPPPQNQNVPGRDYGNNTPQNQNVPGRDYVNGV
ncbi:Multiple organellar RNA editing factor 8-chloroplastic/mitochondrial [Striga hermonthica]|uniref:Multiple organellar RNA editing factor 8-chloroplastic/mitochondrial n=1 Tax=Striga hermonthica TaxID=68872 RepID=A0A9N7MPD5_STRHE|nr:Multiple organellar RNA editing factor 8-chloroplastic/mitochondrial [Striga hermonthica]